jgi:serine/threonine protein kinase
MWAIGVIASILVSGESIFVDLDNHKYAENPKESILNMASVCDMSVLDAKLSWQSAGKRAKDFVKQLLVLDETKRMTVKQALAHPWFSNRINLDHFQRLYQRAIFDWQPRSTDSRMIQSLSVANLHSPIQFGLPAQATLTTSHHFPRLRSATPNIEPLGSTNTTGGEAQSIHEPVLPQILEWDEEYKSLQYHDQCSTLNQRARNMIAKDIEQMDMSLDMNNLSLESSPRQSDVDMNEADENTGSVIPVTVISPRHQSEHTPNLDCGIIERSESPDPIITASPTVQTTRISSMRNSKPYNPMPSTLDLRKKTKSRNRPSLKTYGVTKLSDMYVGDGFAGMFPHSNMSYRRRTKGRKRPRLN